MRKLKKYVYWVGGIDWIVRAFHGGELSTHRGSTYNSYIIKDEKTVLIDTVKEKLTDEFLENVKEVVDPSTIDYVVVNHAEPDHSGALPHIMKYCPNATIVVSKKGLESTKKYYHENESWNFKVVGTGDKINIGKNDIAFVEASMLHWPDSMFTYLTGENILFSNDAFGQHYASSDIFNDMVDEDEVWQESLKYYANILTPFSKLVTKKIEELQGMNLPIDIIAPAHGVIWRKNSMEIVQKYYEWAKWNSEKSVVILYNSMYGATHKMADYIARGVDESGLSYKIYNSATADKNDVITDIFKSKGLLLGSSTINNGILSSLSQYIEELMGLKFINKVGASFGSYGWSGESPKILKEHLEKAKVKVLEEPLSIKYVPTEEELRKCVQFGKSFAEKLLKEL
ncbi:flavodoxin domain-containing protein [Clostridium peptidivorans]|uniref:flavodoxin domain-containing protein n=1 Tax=Clostridium peptidivorans TaxID=100174 RepID=UPI000BE2CBAE|nr:flavodoxin domain-containing protein [Clostridium peptidivorans]